MIAENEPILVAGTENVVFVSEIIFWTDQTRWIFMPSYEDLSS
jgi:hypothetical protein